MSNDEISLNSDDIASAADGVETVEPPKTVAKTTRKTAKQTTKKAGRQSKKAEPKQPKTPPSFVPASMKKKFTPKTVVNFCDSYFKHLYDGKIVSFVKYNEDKKSKQIVIDASHVPSIMKFRDSIEKCENIKQITSSNPYIQTMLNFCRKGKIDPEEFKTLCIEDFEVKPIPSSNILDILKKMAKYTSNTARHVQKAFNFAFGSFYAKKFSDKKDVSKRYVQRAPSKILEILELKNKHFNDDIFESVVKLYYKDLSKNVLSINSLLKSNSIEASVIDEANNRIFTTDNIKKIRENEIFAKVIGKKNISDDEIQSMINTYNELQTAYGFVNFIDNINEQSTFTEGLDEIKKISSKIINLTSKLEELIKFVEKHDEIDENGDNVHWECLIKALVYMTDAHKVFATGGRKAFAIMNKSLGIDINIRNTKLKEAISSAVPTNDKHIHEIAGLFKDEIRQLSIPSTYNPTMRGIYDDLGNYLYNNWNCTSPVQKIPKAVRIAAGMALFQFLKHQIDIISHGKSNIVKIALKF